jgi:hypothetical protein
VFITLASVWDVRIAIVAVPTLAEITRVGIIHDVGCIETRAVATLASVVLRHRLTGRRAGRSSCDCEVEDDRDTPRVVFEEEWVYIVQVCHGEVVPRPLHQHGVDAGSGVLL